MEIKKYKKKNTNQYTIILSDNTSFNFYEDTIINYNLLAKKSFDEKFLKEVIEYNQNFDAYYKALKDITFKLRTQKELENRLKKKNYLPKNIKFAIDRLKSQGYINDELYLKSFIADQITLSLNGPKKIKSELKKLGFSDEKIDYYLDTYEDSIWQERIKKLINKKCKSNHNLSILMLKNKIKKDLILLGYPIELIELEINSFEFQQDDMILEKEYLKLYKKLSGKYENDILNNKIKYSLYKKGFSLDSIDNIINKLVD